MENISISLAAVAASCGTKLVEAKGFEAKRQACLDEVNVGVMKLSKAKAKVGQNKKCSIATAFYDSLIKGGLGKGTAANYLSTFRKAVHEGKPVKEWNPAQSKSKTKTKTKGSKAFVDLFRPAFNHDDGKTFQVLCAEIEVRYQNDDLENFYDAFVDFFKAAGDDIAE